MLHLKMRRSDRHHARIKRVDVEPALAVDGVVRVLTHEDVPNNLYTILSLIGVEPDDEPVLAEDKVRYKGEPIVAVVAETEAAAREGAAAVEVDYEDLPRGASTSRRRSSRRRAAGQAARHELLRLRGPPLPADPLRRRRAGRSPSADHVFE